MKIVSIYPCPCDPAFRHEANVAIYDGHRYYSYEEANLKRLEVVSILDTTENLNAMNKVFHSSHQS